MALEIIAHRGASHVAPENTLASIDLAWRMGADAVEIDVHLTKDARLVVMHDDDTPRTTGAAGLISDQTLSEIRAHDAGSWKGAEWAGQKVPTLEEALDTIPDGKRMFIELKGGPEIVSELDRVVRASDKRLDQIAIISFSPRAVTEAKRFLPECSACFLSGSGGNGTPTIRDLIEEARRAGLDGLDLEANESIDADFAREVKAAGLRLYVWTIDSLEEAKHFAELGVDGITTNRPDVLLQTLRTLEP
ncbi:MAG: glycerophosphodiester phosphodiesterase [Armatimonadota bacterium]|nr:glycerophosphodiester phosphodiesterase [Armatimonadota bacterium]